MDRIELTIFRNLVNNPSFLQKAYPFLKPEYFHDATDKAVFDHIVKYVSVYSTNPTQEALVLSLQADHSLPEQTYTNAVNAVYDLTPVEGTKNDWLLKETETFCQTKAIHNAIMRSINIIDGNDSEMKPDALPTLLSDALSVCFDTNVGHDFFESAEDRYEHYHREEEKLPFDIDYFNKITEGGLPRKTLTCILASMNAGKSLVMCHMAAANLAAGKNVLYISMEMSEYVTSLRIDANLMDLEIANVKQLEKSKFLNRINKLKSKNNGKFIVKEYPTSGAHVGHFKALLNELKLKKNFVPDIIYVDYLNICLSARVKGANANSYTTVKSIAEELRGLAVEEDIPIVTATQTTRGGVGSSDLSMTDVSESIGLAATVDMLLGLIRTPELDEQNQLLFKLLKSRFVDAASFGSFLVGVERSKMKLYDLEKSAQEGLLPPSSKNPIGTKSQPAIPDKDDQQFSGSSFKKPSGMNFDGFKF
jgi:archaellum biogenesis ATPase FlaH